MDFMEFIFWERDRKKLFNPCPHGAYNLEVGKDKDTSNHNPSQKNKITERKVQSAMGGINGDKGPTWLEG